MSKFRLWIKTLLSLTFICILIQILLPLLPNSHLSLFQIMQTLEEGVLEEKEDERNRQSATWEDLLYLITRVANLDPQHPVNGTCVPPPLYNRSEMAAGDEDIPPSFCSGGPALTGRVRKKSRKIFAMWIVR